jgi:hypothetical protein
MARGKKIQAPVMKRSRRLNPDWVPPFQDEVTEDEDIAAAEPIPVEVAAQVVPKLRKQI